MTRTGEHQNRTGQHQNAAMARGFLADEADGRKGEILEAAFAVFAERGYDAGSMRDIAARVGVSEPALYRHFPGKEAIFLALMRAGIGRLRREGLALIDSTSARGLRTRLLAAVSDRRRAVRFYRPFLQTMLPIATRNADFVHEYRETVVRPVFEHMRAKTAELDAELGAPAGADTSRDARIRALVALLVGYMLTSIVLDDEPDEAIVDAALRVMGWDEVA